MALFKKDDILGWKPYPVTIACTFFDVPEEEEIPTLTFEMSKESQEKYRYLDNKYRFGLEYKPAKKQKRNRQFYPEIVNDPVKFCQELLEVCYVESSGIIDEPDKKTMLALLQQEPLFAKNLASEFVKIFEHDEKYKEPESDEKN